MKQSDEHSKPLLFPPAFVVSGTDTDVGKTVISALLCKGLNAGYWKPVQAGVEPSTDTKSVQEWSGLPTSYFYPETYKLKAPMSPHAAAEREGIEISLQKFRLPGYTQNHLIVEGAGGLAVPLNREEYITDLIRHLGLPVLLVARSGLGTINHTLLSLEHLKHLKIPLLGVVLNGPRNPSNEDAIRHFGKIDHLYSVEPLSELTPASLKQYFQRIFS
ncbi:MAG: dethiobiotin synthase [Balneolaceae bacterium]